jgi:hypothetical protein
MLTKGESDPICVDTMPIVRSQLETLYAICLVVEDASTLGLYLKDDWKKRYIRFLVMREECKRLPRITSGLKKLEKDLEELRKFLGISDNQKRTVEREQLIDSTTTNFQYEKIEQFPTPSPIIEKIKDPSRKKMLQRLYPEYRFLSSFSHFSVIGDNLLMFLDDRLRQPLTLTSGEKHEIFQKEVAIPAFSIDLISVAQSCCEFTTIYPNDIELAKETSEAWAQISKHSLLGQSIWKIRTQKLLHVLS